MQAGGALIQSIELLEEAVEAEALSSSAAAAVAAAAAAAAAASAPSSVVPGTPHTSSHGEGGGEDDSESGGGGDGACPDNHLRMDGAAESSGAPGVAAAVAAGAGVVSAFALTQAAAKLPWASDSTTARLKQVGQRRGTAAAAAAVSPFLAWIGSPCLRHCVHGASIGGGGARPAQPPPPPSLR
jgi:hypothetical protein